VYETDCSLPNYLSTIWGGSRLSKIGNSSATRKAFGICREVSTYRNAENTVARGEFVGMNLQALVKQYHKDLMGDDPGDQLIRVAYWTPMRSVYSGSSER